MDQHYTGNDHYSLIDFPNSELFVANFLYYSFNLRKFSEYTPAIWIQVLIKSSFVSGWRNQVSSEIKKI